MKELRQIWKELLGLGFILFFAWWTDDTTYLRIISTILILLVAVLFWLITIASNALREIRDLLTKGSRELS